MSNKLIIVTGEGDHDNYFINKILTERDNTNYLQFFANQSNKHNINHFCSQFGQYRWEQLLVDQSIAGIIYSDEGKNSLLTNHLPQITRQIFGKVKNLNILTLLDEDFTHGQINYYTNELATRIRGLQIKQTRIDITNQSSLTSRVTIVSKVRESYKITFHLFTIPKSLEQQIVEKIREVKSSKISDLEFEKLLEKTISEQIQHLANILKVEKQRLFELPIEENWFSTHLWFQNLTELLENDVIKNNSDES